MKELNRDDYVLVKDLKSPHFGRSGWIAESSDDGKNCDVVIYLDGIRSVVTFNVDKLCRL